MVTERDLVIYELIKKEFYTKRNKKIEAIIDEDYCEFEENYYGDKLTDIYIKADDVRKAKSLFFENILLTFISVSITISFMLQADLNLNFKETSNFLIVLTNLLMLIKWLIISKYKSYIKYIFAKVIIYMNKCKYYYVPF